MKICNRGVNWLQVINEEGDCCTCSWASNNAVGNILSDDVNEIMHSEAYRKFRETLKKGTYEYCNKEKCRYRANGKMDEILIEQEEILQYPEELHLAYEGICNYSCTCCSSHQHMQDAKQKDYENNIKCIEEKLRKILPHVKTLGANGRGELFASKSILKLLSEWKPRAPKEEIKVILETNGSLFDEKHWKQIENLGQYNLKVAITIMSFSEPIYQHLSGTKLPISRIEDNLRFVKKLKEDGIINFLELATVIQEENFREMPEFTRRCIEEFGADRVRLRPIFPGGIYDDNIQWFMDVRNPEHPYYEQYLEVMKNPIFKHPKVLFWTGDLVGSPRKHPAMKGDVIQKTIDRMIDDEDFINKLANIVGKKEVTLYGLGTVGKVFMKINNGAITVNKIIDNYSKQIEYDGITVNKACEIEDKTTTLIVTVYGDYKRIKEEISQQGFTGEIYNIYSILKDR